MSRQSEYGTVEHLAAIDEIVAAEQAATEERDRDVLRALESVEARISEIRTAIRLSNRVPASTTGETFFASDAARVSREIVRRQEAYDVVRKLSHLREKIAAPTKR